MYHRYFGLREAPFSIAVDPRYLFMSDRHRDALAHLLYGVGTGGGFILLTGEVGTGKTTINRCLLEQIPETTDIALVLNPALNAVELLATVCDELNIEYTPGEQSLKVLSDKLHQFLLSNHAKGRNTVLLIDEAQHLQFETLEQIRLLTNLETNTKKLLQIILVGQPELRTLLSRPNLRQLSQRITARYQLQPLTLVETDAYIRHRLKVADLPAGQTLFPKAIVKRIHKASRGIPRIINTLCDRMLLGAYGQQKTVVNRSLFRQALVEVLGEKEPVQRSNWPAYTLAALLIVCVTAGVLLWLQATPQDPQAQTSQTLATQPQIVEQKAIEQQVIEQPIEVQIPEETVEAPEPEPLKQQPVATALSKLEASMISNRQQALTELSTWTYPEQGNGQPCQENDPRFRCERLTAATWQDLLTVNRPAVLSLVTPAKQQSYAVLVALTEDSAQLLSDGRLNTVPLAELGPLWSGEFTIAWQPPPGYRRPFSRATSGAEVQWLAEQFAELDNQQVLLAQRQFTQPLFERVKIFQSSHQLKADGVVGLNTLLKISEQQGLATTLARELLEQDSQEQEVQQPQPPQLEQQG